MDAVKEKPSDKRNFTRLKMETPALLVIHERAKKLRGICRDLSGGGMLMETKVGLPKGLEVEVTLDSLYGPTPMLKARTQVARSERKASGFYILGLEILEILD